MKSHHSGEMTQESDLSPNMEKHGTVQEDLTGRERLAMNVLFNWGGHLAVIVAGCVLPRMIDLGLAQRLLGTLGRR